MSAVDEVIFWGVAYTCFLAATVAYIVALWRGLDVAALVGRLTGALGAGLMVGGLALRLARIGRWLPAGSGEVATAAAVVAVIVLLIFERRGKLQSGGAGVLVWVVLLDSFVLWSLVIGGQGSVALVTGRANVLDVLRVTLDVIACGCLLVSGGLGLARLIPARWSVAGRPSADALDVEAWRALVWGTSALSGRLVIGALAVYLAGRNLWAAESGLLGPMAAWVACGGIVAVERAGGWRATLAMLATAAALVAMLAGGG